MRALPSFPRTDTPIPFTTRVRSSTGVDAMRTVRGSFAEQVDQAPADFLDVITAHPFKTSGALLSNSAQRLCNGLLIFRLVDPVIVPHFLQHPVPSRQRLGRASCRERVCHDA